MKAYFSNLSQTALFVVLSSSLQLSKQLLLGIFLLPEHFAVWSLTLVLTQLVTNFGSLGYNLYASSESVKNFSIGKHEENKNLVGSSFLIYFFISPFSILIAAIALDFRLDQIFPAACIYVLSNILFNCSLVPTYVESSKTFILRQFYKSALGFLVTVFLLFFYKDLFLIIFVEALIILSLAIYFSYENLRGFSQVNKVLKDLKDSIFNFFPSILSATLFAMFARIVASNTLNDEELGRFFFLYIILNLGMYVNRFISIIVGPILPRQLKVYSSHEILKKLFKPWLISILLCLIISTLSSLFIQQYFNNELISYLLFPIILLTFYRALDIWSVLAILLKLPKVNTLSSFIALFLLSLALIISIFFTLENINLIRVLIYLECIVVITLPPLFLFYFSSKLQREDNNYD